MVLDLDSEFFDLLGAWSGSERGLTAQDNVQMFRLTVVGEVSKMVTRHSTKYLSSFIHSYLKLGLFIVFYFMSREQTLDSLRRIKTKETYLRKTSREKHPDFGIKTFFLEFQKYLPPRLA